MPWDAAARYRLLMRINAAILKHTNREDLFQALAREVRQVFHYDRFSINIYDPHSKSLSYFSTADGVSPQEISSDGRPLDKGAIAQAVIRSRKPLILSDLRQRSYWASVRAMLEAGLTASMAFPLITRGHVLGSIHFSFKKRPENLESVVEFLTEFADVVAVAVENMLAHTRLKEMNRNLKQQKNYLLEHSDGAYRPDAFFYASPAMAEVMRQVELIAGTDASVLITGETGTGKDFVARHIHRLSPRREALFVKINCPALSPSLFESELFGHAKGAFTGASQKRTGRFEMAHGGTVFLDEMGELPLELQAKLLHVLQDKRFERVGDSRPIEVDFRVVAATNRDLEQAVRAGQFRSDLYYRLNTVTIHLPPLRERREDVPLLVRRLTELQARSHHRPAPTYTPSAMEVLCRHQWPGNVRELKNLVKRMVILRPGEAIGGRDMQAYIDTCQAGPSTTCLTLAEVERQHIETVLARTGGVLGGPQGAAALLGIPRTTLQYRLKKYGIDPKSFAWRGEADQAGRVQAPSPPPPA